MNEEYFIAKNGECFRYVDDTSVLRHISVSNNESKFEVIVAGRHKTTIGETGNVIGGDHDRFYKRYFVRWGFAEYLKECEK